MASNTLLLVAYIYRCPDCGTEIRVERGKQVLHGCTSIGGR